MRVALLLPHFTNVGAFAGQERVMSVIKKSSGLVAVFLGMFVSSARAQEMFIVRVPFPFVVRGDQLPAGRYDVTVDNGLLFIRNADRGSGVFATTFGAGGGDPAGDKPALVFVRRESDYVLSQIWESSTEGRALPGLTTVEHHAEAQPVASDGPTVVLAGIWK
jgi:hypothetical protein